MSGRIAAARRSIVAAGIALLLGVGVVAGLPLGTARADTAPLDPADPATPTTVSADPLPTAQINGVAWAQVVVGNTVYVTGEFTRARPAGAAPGTSEVVRNNLLAYDIRTGELISSFAPDLNAQGQALAASPDGSRLYVGGDFSRANGQTRYHVAAYSTDTGQLIDTFRPAVGGIVRAIAATNTTVYLGGDFSAVGGTARNRLAAISVADGSLLPWAPQPGTGPTSGNRDGNTATSNSVLALVVTGNGSQVVAGGRFYTMNGARASAISALDPVSGATRPFAVNQLITNQGANSAVFSLIAQGDTIYATAYDYFGPGNIEASFAAAANGGALIWANTCRGDHYSSFPMNGVLYHATHAHDCGNIGSYPEQTPRQNMFGTAVTLAAVGTTGPGNFGNGAFANKPAPKVLPWWPNFYSGTYTGQYQAGWTVSGNSEYLVYGGEFPRVNAAQQQGLVRFAVRDIAPNDMGPRATSTPIPTVSMVPGAVRVSWKAVADQDNEYLTYRVYRDSDTAAPVCETTRGSEWWRLPTFACTDTTASAGSHRYLVTATDAFDNRLASSWTTATVGAANRSAARMYADLVLADGALNHWPLGEASGSIAYDRTSTRDLTINSGVTRGQAGAIAGDTDKAFRFGGTSTGFLADQTAAAGPQAFSVEAWFQTTTRAGGKIVGYGNARTGTSTSHDRHVYMDTAGRVLFGVHNGAARTISTTTAYNDGKWHHAVGTLGPNGMAFYVDGVLIGSRPEVRSAAAYSGYWRVGGDTSWSGGLWFAGQVDEVAVYPSPLTAGQVSGHNQAGRTGAAPNVVPTAAFTASTADLTVSVDGSGSTDSDGGITGYAWNFGDGGTASGVAASHTYAAAGTYPVTLTVTDTNGVTGTVTRSVTVSVSAPPPGSALVATDAFGREVTGGWGTADLGGAWTTTGATANATVSGGSGRISAAAGGTSAASLPVSARDVAVRADVLVERAPSGGGAYVSLVNRDRGASNRYSAQLRFSASGSVTLSLTSLVDGTETELASYRMAGSYTPGTVLKVRFQTVGSSSTTLGAKVWASGTAEPAVWQVSATDSAAALQQAGAVRFDLYNSTTATSTQTLRVDNLQAVQFGAAEPPANTAPTAAFTSSVSGMAVSVDGSGSSDAEGPVASYSWNFGDGATGAGATASHTYATAGTYPVTLTVTDATGTTGTATHSVTVAAEPPANTAPTAAFTSSVSGLAVSVDGSGSSDAEGPVASYSWNFGDGATGAGATASHTYATAGTYPVTLTVTDATGTTGTVTHSVTVAAPTPDDGALAADAFSREVAGGWGAADLGGTWRISGSAANATVTGGSGRLTAAAGATLAAELPLALQDLAVQADVLLERAPTGGGSYVSLVSRYVSSTRYEVELRFSATGSVTVSLLAVVNSTENLLGSYRLAGTYTPGTVLKVRFETAGSGTTTLRAMAWASGAAEPAAWQVSATDSRAELQRPGTVRAYLYQSSTATSAQTLRVDNLWIGAAGTKPKP